MRGTVVGWTCAGSDECDAREAWAAGGRNEGEIRRAADGMGCCDDGMGRGLELGQKAGQARWSFVPSPCSRPTAQHPRVSPGGRRGDLDPSRLLIMIVSQR